jgi:3-hydroxymyristoyl/3-hydroxydecanoyl-(acyl carrier protein) dehydratase
VTAAGAFADVELGRDAARAVVRPEHAHALCVGHFPGDPLVPGAYLLGLMAALGEQLLGGAEPVGVERCVFRHRVRPSAPIVVHARRRGPDAVDAEILSGDTTAARALVRYRGAA